MSYLTEIYRRLDIQQICEFLLHGTECLEIDRRTQIERMKEAGRELEEGVCRALPEGQGREQVLEMAYHYAATCENVYMEIGLQAGMQIAAQGFIQKG